MKQGNKDLVNASEIDEKRIDKIESADEQELNSVIKKQGFIKKAIVASIATTAVVVAVFFGSLVAGFVNLIQAGNLNDQNKEIVQQFKAGEEYKKVYTQYAEKYSNQLKNNQITIEEHKQKMQYLTSQDFIDKVCNSEKAQSMRQLEEKKWKVGTVLFCSTFATGVGAFELAPKLVEKLNDKKRYLEDKRNALELKRKKDDEQAQM